MNEKAKAEQPPHEQETPIGMRRSRKVSSRSDRGWVLSGLIALIFILALGIGVLVLVVPAVLSPPPTPGPVYELFDFGEVSADLDPGRDQLLQIDGGDVALYIPVGAYAGSGTIVMQPRDLEFVPILSDGSFKRLRAVDLLIISGAGEIVADPTFEVPPLLCFKLSDNLQFKQAADGGAVTVQQFEEQQLAWLDLSTGPGWDLDQICATIDHLSIFALAARLDIEVELPEPALKLGATSTPEPLEIYTFPQVDP